MNNDISENIDLDNIISRLLEGKNSNIDNNTCNNKTKLNNNNKRGRNREYIYI